MVDVKADDLIYVENVVEMLGNKITKRVVYDLIREKKLPAMKLGKRYLLSRKVVETFISKKLGKAS